MGYVSECIDIILCYGGKTMRKPYAVSNYVLNMSDFKKENGQKMG